MQFQQSHGATAVTEHHEFFAKHLHAKRQVAKIIGEADRLPEAAQIFPAGGPWADMREFGILLRNVAMKVAAEPGPQKRGSRGQGSPPVEGPLLEWPRSQLQT